MRDDEESVWKIVNKTRKLLYKEEQDCSELSRPSFIKRNNDKIEDNFNFHVNITHTMNNISTKSLGKCVIEKKEIFYSHLEVINFFILICILFISNYTSLLETAAKMFTFLNQCPVYDYNSLFEHILKTSSPKQILIALINILKTSKNAYHKSALKIFYESLKVMNLCEFKVTEIHNFYSCANISMTGPGFLHNPILFVKFVFRLKKT